MGFFIQWVWYALAFLTGSAVAWGIVTVAIEPTSAEEALAHVNDGPEPEAHP